MAFTTYPLNNVDCSAEDAELFHCTRSSGIYAGDDFQISVTGADRSITIGPGLGWIRNSKFSGKVVAQKESATLELGLSDATYPRIDAVVIRFSAADNRTTLVVKQGAAAAEPRSPVPERTEAVHELHLCNVRRPAGSTVVTDADVIDLRMNAYYCGLMADSVTQVDTEAIEAQINGLINRLDAAIAQTQGGAGFVSKTLLWENGSPGEAFTDRFIDIPINNYDAIEIICDTPYIVSTGIIPLGESRDILVSTVYGSPNELRRDSRNFGLNTAMDCISVGPGRSDELNTFASSEQPLVMVPVKIYGYTGTIDPNAEVPPADPQPSTNDIMFDLDVDMSTGGRLRFTNDQQMQKVYDNNMAIHVVYYTEPSGARHVFECACPSVKSVLPIGSASGGAIVFANGYYNNQNENSRYIICLYFDPSKFAADETLEVAGGSYMNIPTGVTVARVYASIF